MATNLVATFTEALDNPDNILLTLLLDSSGSIGNEYPTMKHLAMTILNKLPGITTQVIQFATSTRIECPFTMNVNQIKKAVEDMKHMATGTNMEEAFSVTMKTHQLIVNPESKPVVFFVTDGEPSNDPRRIIGQFLSMTPKPVIIGIGVGSGTKLENIAKLIPGQPHFHCGNFAELTRQIEQLTVAPKSDPCIRVEAYPGGSKIQKSTESLLIKLRISPEFPLKEIPAGTQIICLPNNFFYRSAITVDRVVKENEFFTVELILAVRPEGKLFGALPECIKTEMVIPGRPRKIAGMIRMRIGWLAGDLVYDADPKKTFNILIWGPMGGGKSSLINGFATALSDSELVKFPLTTFRSDNHVTVDYSGKDLAWLLQDDSELEDSIRENVKIKFWDPWGVTPSTHNNLKLEHFLEGRVPNETEINDLNCRSKVNDDNIIDAIIFVIPATSAADSVMLEKLQGHLKTALHKNLNPIVVINYSNAFSDEKELKNNQRVIAQKSMISARDIYYIDNYIDEQFKNMVKDLDYFKLLKDIFRRATLFYGGQRRVNPGPINQGTPKSGSVNTGPESMKKDSKNCSKRDCDNFSKPVETPVCPFCGTTPELAILITGPYCSSQVCPNFKKSVETPVCPYCGTKPVNPKLEVQSAAKVCVKDTCSNFSKPVEFPRCPFCGILAETLKPKVKICLSKHCEQFEKPVEFPRCPYCGSEPSFPRAERLCRTVTCPNNNKKVQNSFPMCPFCGVAPP